MSREKNNERFEKSSRPHGKRLLMFFGGVTVLLACAAIRFAGGDPHVSS